MKKYIYFLLFFFISIHISAQVGINMDNSDPNASAMLDVKSTNKGVLIPRMSSTERQQILEPAVGLMVYDSTAQAFYYFNGMGWLELLSSKTISDFTPADITFDATSPSDYACLEVIGSIGLGTLPRDVVAQGNFIYVIDGTDNNLKIIDVSTPTTPTERGSISFPTGSPLAIAVADNFAYVTIDNGADDFVRVVDVSDLDNPTLRGNSDHRFDNNQLIDIQVVGNDVFALSETDGFFEHYDVSNPDNPRQTTGTVNTANLPKSFALQGDYAYIVDEGPGILQIFNISAPTSIRNEGTLSIGDDLGDITVSGNYAYILNIDGNSLDIIDITTPSMPVALSSVSTSVALYDELVILEEVIVKTSRGSDEVTVIDIKDKMNPAVIGNLSVGTDPRGIAMSNGLLYVIDWNTKDLKVINPCTAILSYAPNNETGFTKIMANEIDKQILSLANSSLSISNGNAVDLASINTDDQTIDVLDLNGSTFEISLENDGQATQTLDLSSINAIQNLIEDLDNDTKIQVEKNADEDIIRFDVGGTETFRMVDSRLEVIDPLASIYIGLNSGSNRDNVQSLYNVMLGHEAGKAITEGANNVGIGTFSLNSNQTGGSNTVLGAFAARLNTAGNNNVAVGTRAIFDNETGSNNVAIGLDAGRHNTGSGNIFLGYEAGQNETGSNQLYIENSNTTSPLIYGDFASDSVSVNGNLNIAGDRLAFANTYDNVFIGDGAGFNNVDNGGGLNDNGRENVFIGDLAGHSNTLGQFNVGLGSGALHDNTTGQYNLALGYVSLFKNTEGSLNVGVGPLSLGSNINAAGNTALGFRAGGITENGGENVFIGAVTGGSFNPIAAVDMANNVMVGYAAGGNNTGNNNVFLGHKAGFDATGDNKLYIDNSDTTAALIYGEFDNDLVRINGDLEVTGGIAGTAPVGAIMMWATATPPDGWVICNGQSITAYPQLVAVLGSNNAPNLQNRFPFGSGSLFNTGETGGRQAVTLTEANIPEHNHDSGTLKTQYDYKSNNSSAGSASNKDGSDVQFYNGNAITGNTGNWGGLNGSTKAFEIIPPFLALNFIIKAE